MLLKSSRMSWIESSENSLCCLREVDLIEIVSCPGR